MKCPHPGCSGRLLQKSVDGASTRVRIDGPISIGDDGVCRAKCFWCKGEVTLPLSLTAPEPAERLEDRARPVVERVTVRVVRPAVL